MTWKHISPLEEATRNKRAYSLAALSFALKEAHRELSRLSLNKFMLWVERHEKATSEYVQSLLSPGKFLQSRTISPNGCWGFNSPRAHKKPAHDDVFNPAFDFACILGYTDDDEPDLVLLKVIWNKTFLLLLLCGWLIRRNLFLVVCMAEIKYFLIVYHYLNCHLSHPYRILLHLRAAV